MLLLGHITRNLHSSLPALPSMNTQIDKKRMQAAGMVSRVKNEVEIHSRLKHPSILEVRHMYVPLSNSLDNNYRPSWMDNKISFIHYIYGFPAAAISIFDVWVRPNSSSICNSTYLVSCKFLKCVSIKQQFHFRAWRKVQADNYLKLGRGGKVNVVKMTTQLACRHTFEIHFTYATSVL